jgi:hypothetical protein
MSEQKTPQADIPVLMDVVNQAESGTPADAQGSVDNANLIAELQTQLASGAFALTEQLLHTAFSEMEATLYEHVSNRLRQELPELIDKILRDHLGDDSAEP